MRQKVAREPSDRHALDGTGRFEYDTAMETRSRLPEDLLAAIPIVLAAAEEPSATRIAARLGTTAARVLRRIDSAELVLGQRLFVRSSAGLEATAALATVLPWAQKIAASCDGLRRDLAGLDPRVRGHVRVAVPPTMASHLLVPHLGLLREAHPLLTVEFDTSTHLVDLSQRDADIAVRGQRPDDGELVQRKLGDYCMVVACSPALAARYRDRLDELPWLTWARSLEDILEARWLKASVPHATIALRASELSTLLHAARAGLGALLAPEAIAAKEGGLVSLPLDLQLPEGSLWLVTHQALRPVPKVAAVWSWLEQVFESMTPEATRLAPAW